MQKLQVKQLLKYAFLFWFGGSFYVTLEVFYRARSHFSMFILAGVVFILVGLLNEIWSWEFSILKQIAIGTFMATVLEFFTGVLVNIILGWNVWDYSNLKWNLCSQIAPQFVLLWIPLVFLAIVVDDVIRWKFFGEEKPRYKI